MEIRVVNFPTKVFHLFQEMEGKEKRQGVPERKLLCRGAGSPQGDLKISMHTSGGSSISMKTSQLNLQ